MIKIILVEDEELIRKGMKLTTPWTEFDCEVVGEAPDAMTAEEMILRIQPDIVITDIRMPKVSGLEMIEKLREQVSCEYIILSGYDEFAYAKKALNLGVCGYLLKPIDDGELHQVLGQTVNRVKEKQAIYQTISENQKQITGEERGTNFHDLQDKYLEKACEIIRARCCEELSLKDVAEELNISESYLGKLFKHKTNYTFLAVLTLYRIKSAAALLQDTDMKIYEITDAVGYSDAKYFSKVFKKVVGVKPMEFKKGYQLSNQHILNQL